MATIQPVGWDGVWANPRMPASGETVNGERFTIPRGTKSVSVHCPALVGTGATVKFQALTPLVDIENGSETWTDIKVFDLTDGSFEALDGIVESTCVVIPASAIGNTVVRFVASEDQSGTPSNIPVFCNFGG